MRFFTIDPASAWSNSQPALTAHRLESSRCEFLTDGYGILSLVLISCYRQAVLMLPCCWARVGLIMGWYWPSFDHELMQSSCLVFQLHKSSTRHNKITKVLKIDLRRGISKVAGTQSLDRAAGDLENLHIANRWRRSNYVHIYVHIKYVFSSFTLQCCSPIGSAALVVWRRHGHPQELRDLSPGFHRRKPPPQLGWSSSVKGGLYPSLVTSLKGLYIYIYISLINIISHKNGYIWVLTSYSMGRSSKLPMERHFHTTSSPPRPHRPASMSCHRP